MPRTKKGWKGYEDLSSNPVPGDMLTSLEEIGIRVIREVNDEILGHCPAHKQRTGKEDTHPSWSVNIDSGLFNCFSCGYTGTFVDLVVYMTEMSHGAAVAWTKARGGVEKVRKSLSQTVDTLQVDTTSVINEASLALFVDPPKKAREKRHLTLEACQHFGVLWDTKREMWIIPIRDPDTGVLLGWQEKNERYFRNKPYSMKKSTTLFGINEFPTGEVAVLVESPLDVVRLYGAGISGGLACFGSKVSKEQMSLLVMETDQAILAFDNDTAGWGATEDIRVKYRNDIGMRVLNYTGITAVDIGKMSDAEIHRAINTAYSTIVSRL